MIRVENICIEYPKKVIFKDFNMFVDAGEFIAVTGQSGSGKSTLLNIIGGLEVPKYGHVFINDIQVNKKSRSQLLRDEITYLFQNYALVDTFTVEKNLLLAIKYQNKSRAEKQKAIYNALVDVGMGGFEHELIYNLSGGEQQRIALARVILKDSNVILTDEPTGNLDPKNSQKIFNILKKLNKEGKTIIMVTHNNELAMQCDRIVKI
jgi:putative ABC transport system ATP-binding protein